MKNHILTIETPGYTFENTSHNPITHRRSTLIHLKQFNIPVYLKLVFLVMFFGAILCGCGGGNAPKDNPVNGNDINGNNNKPIVWNREELNAEIIRQIRLDYFNNLRDSGYNLTNINDVWVYSYYGTYNDCIIVMMYYNGIGYPNIIEKIDVAGVLFYYSSPSHKIIAWKAGQFYDLGVAHYYGLLTREDLVNIANLHAGIYDYLDGNHARLSAETEGYIKQSYLDQLWYNEGMWELTIDDVWIEEYYGIYNVCVAVMIDANGLNYTDEERVVVIDDVLFHYNSGNSIVVWVKQAIPLLYELQEAYDFGFLTQEDLKIIADQHNRIIE